MAKEEKKQDSAQRKNRFPFKIPVEGSLGLLALGAVGITEWRKVRNAYNKKKRIHKIRR